MVSADPPARRAPTIRDVARLAQVGVGTVSRVLNASPLVKPDKRARVLAAIEELGFRRNPMARNLSVGRAHAIGVVAPFFATPSSMERLRGVAECLSARGYGLLIADVEAPAQRERAFAGVTHASVDGVIVISMPLSDDEARALERTSRPVVLIDVADRGLPDVSIDDVYGGRLATDHLLGKGHRRIGFVGDVVPSPFGFTSSERRRNGYREALAAAGIEPDARLERHGGHQREDARALATPLLSLPDRPTAIFAASDVQAIGVLEAAAAAGLRVPGDLAVIGFDDIELADVVGLTTVRQPLRQSGIRGAELLLAAIEPGEPRPSGALDPLAVIQRATT
jgi:DNA-binding LacI/PurR family transcriptional regulator